MRVQGIMRGWPLSLASASGWPVTPIIKRNRRPINIGIEQADACAPSRAKAVAKLTATVDLPTPPLPADTAMT
jgi:hypothetical protein